LSDPYAAGTVRDVKGYAHVVAVALACVACSDPDPSSPAQDAGAGGTGSGGTGGGSSTGGPLPIATGGAPPRESCNDLELTAPPAAVTFTQDAPPAAEGGTITDGTYFLTKQNFYEVPALSVSSLGRARVEIAEDAWEQVEGDVESGGTNPDKDFSYTFFTVGVALTLVPECPSSALQGRFEYTAAAGEFTVFVTDRGKTVGTVFTKQ
jgi:hypothetical protein